jgi:zinc and cadmium transporter
MNLLAIVIGTLVAGIGSVWAAGLLTYGVLARYTQHLLSLAAGALLATAFMHLLPEAFESQAGAQALFSTLLAGLIFFFLLDKAELYHHGHEHHHGGDEAAASPASTVQADAHAHTHDHDHASHSHAPSQSAAAHSVQVEPALTHAHAHGHASGGGWAVLLGDGILIAAAYMADFRLGLAATLAVLVHEIPHHMGDLVVLRQARQSASKALAKLSAAGAVTVLGGVVGYLLVEQLQSLLPYLLVVASSSFIYVALADLIPQLQKRLSLRETVAQVAWLAVGILLVTMVSSLAHGH